MQKLKLILFGQSITALIYATVYLLKSFIIWKFTNPFFWIINLGTFGEGTRFLILFYTLFYYGVLFGLIFSNKKHVIKLLNI